MQDWRRTQSQSNPSPLPNSLLTGKLTGNFSILDCFPAWTSPLVQLNREVREKFPTHRSREFLERTGNFRSRSGNFRCAVITVGAPPFIHKSICASMSASALRASKSAFPAMICSRPANWRTVSSTMFECRMRASKCSRTRPPPSCEPILDRPLVGSGPPHDRLHGLMAVAQFGPQRRGDRCGVTYLPFPFGFHWENSCPFSETSFRISAVRLNQKRRKPWRTVMPKR